ncbi:MAG: hypothetical protein KFF73_18920 [Cyclobacteriaceae bacterium]|nr:hypothetical protein [Cyclobacteriaceae bacterium]
MKSNLIFFIPLFIFFQGCGDPPRDDINLKNAPQDLHSLIKGFKNPPIDYSTIPFWVWNDQVTRKKINDQLLSFKNNGIHQVFIHPRPGLITEYLSTEWFELIAYAVQKGKELDMKLWLYDENSFPSGFAGGHVPASLPPDADLVVGLKMHKFQRLDPADIKDYPVVLKKIGNTFANISKGIQNYLDETGEYYAFSKWYYPDGAGMFGGYSYVDLLAYGITERFIRITMMGYEDYVGEEFGKTVPGVFTDEPHIHTSNDSAVIKYTPVLFSRFSETYEYPLENYLPCLFEEIGDWKNVRHDYYALLLDMFIERWAKPWKAYTDTSGLQWTGHYWEHMWPNPEYVADNMAMYAWHQIPGIDMLFNDEKGRPDQFGNTRAVKELSSVANQLGKSRTLSETYGGSGWDLDFMDMKRLGDWEFALGVNMLNQHLSYMTLKGARKRDFPLSFSYHSPWWDQYKVLGEYFHRLSFVLSSGQQVNKTLIIEPTSTAWMYHAPGQGQEKQGVAGKIKTLDNSFRYLLDSLEKYQVEYDLGSEKIIAESGEVQGNQFIVGHRKYSLVILPPSLENLERSTYELLINYLENGGRLVISGHSPSYIDGNISREAKSTFSRISLDPSDKETILENISVNDLHQGSFVPLNPEHWNGRVFHHRREMKGGHILFLCNSDTRETSSILFRTAGASVIELDPFTGEIYDFPVKQEKDSLLVRIELPPANSKLLFLSDKKGNFPEVKVFDPEKSEEISGGKTRIIRNGFNSLTLDYCDLEIKGRIFRDIYFYQAADTIFKEYLGEIYGFNYNPWSVAVQYRSNILDKNSMLQQKDGYSAHFTFTTGNDFKPGPIRAVIENPDLSTVQLNNQPLRRMPDQWWLDKDFGVYDLSGLIRQGRNKLTIHVSPMNVLAELEPVYIIGDFAVSPSENGWELKNTAELNFGSWKDMGLPFYPESVSYIKDLTIKNPGSVKYLTVELPAWNGSVAEIIINREHAGQIAWPPYQLDITDHVREGNNEIEVKVYGSLKNLLGPHHNNPTRGIVTPWSFFYAPGNQPPGKEYDLIPCGLNKDFVLKGY